MGFPYNEVVHIFQKYISARKKCFGHPKVSTRCLQTSTGSVHSIPHTRAAWDGLRNEPQPTATVSRHLPPLRRVFQEPCSYRLTIFITIRFTRGTSNSWSNSNVYYYRVSKNSYSNVSYLFLYWTCTWLSLNLWVLTKIDLNSGCTVLVILSSYWGTVWWGGGGVVWRFIST